VGRPKELGGDFFRTPEKILRKNVFQKKIGESKQTFWKWPWATLRHTEVLFSTRFYDSKNFGAKKFEKMFHKNTVLQMCYSDTAFSIVPSYYVHI
jgi:hypothetical protein